jgi:tetratricopeptide (TPR) repeat protein
VSVLGQTSAQGLTVESSPDDWRAQGNNLLQRQMFDLAAKCFRKSGDNRLENEAAAQHLMYKEAPKLQQLRGNFSKLVELYLEAAERFMAAGVSELSVANALLNAAHFAGRACAQKDGDRKLSQSFFELAGRAYTLCARADNASDDVLKKAIRCLRKAERSSCTTCAVDLLVFRGKYLHALKLLREEHRYEEALSLLEKHQAHPSLDLPPQHDLHKPNLLRAAAGHHALSAQNPKQGEESQASSYARFLKIVSRMTAEDEEHCLLTHGYKQELIQRLVARNSFSKAGQLLSRDGKRIEACKILCETNPNPGEKDLSIGIELLLAHAVQKECCEGERLESVMKARELQSRLDAIVSTAKTGEEAYGLDLFMARIESNPKQKEDRLKRLMEKTAASHDQRMDFPLLRVLAGCELFCIQTHQNQLKSLDAPPEWFKENVHLLSDLDTIMAKLTDKDTNKETENRYEIFFGIRRPFGMCCISPARKQIMDWMLESDTFLAQPSPVRNRDGDFVIEPSVLKSAVLKFFPFLWMS